MRGWTTVRRVGDVDYVVTGFALSQTTPEATLAYRLSVTKIGEASGGGTRQAGRFEPRGGVPDTLSSVRLECGPGEGARIELVLRDRRRVLHRHRFDFEADRFPAAGLLRDSLGASAYSPEDRALIAEVDAQAPDSLTADAPAVELEIDGLVVDETRTKPGRDFYGYFYRAFQAPAGVSDYGLTLREEPVRGRISRVAVLVDGVPVFRPLLQPRQDLLERIAEQAAQVVARHLQQRDQLDQLADPDQAGDGLY